MITWRMEVKDETFTDLRDHPSVGQDYITPDAGVASLDSFSVDGAGNCLEAQFRASPKFVDIRPRDIVSLEVSEDNGSTWTPVYRGYVVTAGNPRSDDIQAYKLVGLRQRFFEITNTITHLDSDDPATQASNLFTHLDSEGDWPAGVVSSVPLIPLTAFLNEDVYPQAESYGDTFKQIADAAGRFVVNLGDSYTYDGVTYNEGDTVLGVRFGVDASGNAFFRRPQGNVVTYAEGDDGIVANYVQVTGEEIFDIIELVYANENKIIAETSSKDYVTFDGTTFRGFPISEAIVQPLKRTFIFGGNNSRRVVNLQSPLAFMTTENISVANTSGGVTNASGAISGGVTAMSDFGGSVYYENTDMLVKPDGFLITFEARRTDDENYYLTVVFGSTFGPRTLEGHVARVGNISPERSIDVTNNFQFYSLTVLPAANVNPTSDVTTPRDVFETRGLEMGGKEVEFRNLNIYVPDVDAGGTTSEQFASGFVRDVQENVAEVKSVGELGQVADRVNWTPERESPVTVPVERIQYTLTTRDGLVTTYELGQAYDAEALSQRKVLKDLAREAVSE